MHRLRPAFVAFFVIILTVPARGAILLDKVVAVVNQDVITWSELYKAMEMDAPPDVRAMTAEEKKKIFSKQEGHLLENLIDIKLELQQAASDGLTASPEEIQDAVNTIKKKYSMNASELAASLKKEGYSMKEYRKRLGEQILVSKVVDREIRSKIVVSDSDVSKYIQENRKELEADKGYRISQIFFHAPANAKDREGLFDKAEGIEKRIRAGERFEDLAKKYSEDPSATSGGDLGFIKEDQLSTEFRAQLSKMKVGDVSSPFWTASGLHIIKLVERPGLKSKSEIEDEARNELTRRLFALKYKEWVKRLRGKAFIDVKL